MIESVTASENTALSYFFDELETEAEGNALKCTYVFPYAEQVLDLLITYKNSFKNLLIRAKNALKNSTRILG